MKKALLAIPLILALTGCGNDVDLVKDGIMEFNQTTTVGQALDNWRSCEEGVWGNFKTSNGIKVVQFTCQHKVDQFLHKVKSLLSKKTQDDTNHLDVASEVQVFQFTVNQDKTFQIDNVQATTTWEDGTSYEESQKPIEQLEIAYGNKMMYNSIELNEATAGSVDYFFKILKSEAK